MNATARAHPNIALVKYWGKRDERLNLPAAPSLSVTLEGLSTTTEVRFDDGADDDLVILDGQRLDDGRPRRRIVDFLDLIRRHADLECPAVVKTENDFPTAAGLASSASGFAALAVAATAAAGRDWLPPKLSALARRGSGSAARSIFGGFVQMQCGKLDDGSDSHGGQVAPADHWDLRCLIALTARGKKKVGSTEGMRRTRDTSPFYDPWIGSVEADIQEARRAIQTCDFEALAAISERSCLRMHASAIGAEPGILYWNATTVELIHRVRSARLDGLPCFFTIDAGPHVKVFCPAAASSDAHEMLRDVAGVFEVLETRPGEGARLIS